MIVLKGDIVRTSYDATGEVTEIWGVARTFLRIRLPKGRTALVFETDITEILERPKQQKRNTSSSRERG